MTMILKNKNVIGFKIWKLSVYYYGRWSFAKYNLIPALTSADICGDNDPYTKESRWYQLSWFGQSLNLEIDLK